MADHDIKSTEIPKEIFRVVKICKNVMVVDIVYELHVGRFKSNLKRTNSNDFEKRDASLPKIMMFQ